MQAWSKYLREGSWGRSFLIKSGMLGIGLVAVLWAGWPQPQIGHHDRSPLPDVFHESTAIQRSPQSSSPVAVTSNINPLQVSGEESEEENLQVEGITLLVDLNLGSRMELEALPGIGMKLADRIVSYRSIHGAFQQVKDLVKVSGIGEKRLQRLKPFVKVQTRFKEKHS